MNNNVASLPHSAEAEAGLLGCILLEPPIIEDLELAAADFFLERHADVYAAMRQLWEDGYPIDPLMLADELARQHKLDEIGGHSFIADLITNVPSAIYARQYAQRVRRYALLRRYIAMAQKLVEMSYGAASPDDLFSWLNTQLQTIRMDGDTNDGLMTWEESFEVARKMLEDLNSRDPQEASAWAMPWASWNRYIDPLERGSLVGIAAPDKTGKTLFAECIAEFWASRGHVVGFAHFELNERIMLQRRICRHARIERRDLITPNRPAEITRRAEEAEARINAWPGRIEYQHCPTWSIERVCAEARARGWDALIVDYLEMAQPSRSQLTRFKGDDGSRREANDVAQLKDLSESMGIRTVFLSQFNKAGKDTSFEHLTANNVRGAGEKAEKASVFVLLHREVLTSPLMVNGDLMGNAGDRSPFVNVRVDRNTMGTTGNLKQIMQGQFFDVRDIAE